MNRDQFVNSYGQPMDWLMATARRNPEAFLVMAAGAALLMRGRGSSPNRAPDYRQMRNWQGSGNGARPAFREQRIICARALADTARRFQIRPTGLLALRASTHRRRRMRCAPMHRQRRNMPARPGKPCDRRPLEWLTKRRTLQAKPTRRFNPVQGP